MRKYAIYLTVAGAMAAARLAGAAAAPDSEKVSKLLSEVKTMAFQVKEDAATMESFTYMNVSLQSHKVAIDQIKDHVNALGRQVDRLKAARSEASPWQQTAIDRITPFLDELGGYTDAILEHFNGTERHDFAEYKDLLEANADYSADLAAMIAQFVDYGNTKARLERLGAKLEIRPAK
jgi:hypothetical protein